MATSHHILPGLEHCHPVLLGACAQQICCRSRSRSSTGTHYSSQYLLDIQHVYAQQRQLPQLPRACDGTDQTSLKRCHCHSLHVTAVPPTWSFASYQPSMPCPSPTRSCTQTRPACACIPQLHGTLLTGNIFSKGALTDHTSIHMHHHNHARLRHQDNFPTPISHPSCNFSTAGCSRLDGSRSRQRRLVQHTLCGSDNFGVFSPTSQHMYMPQQRVSRSASK